MFAVIQTGGKQYKVVAGDVLNVERIPGEVGDTVELNEVLLLDNDGDTKVGRPLIDGAHVAATITNQGRAPKVTIFKKIRRHGKQLKKGHRQQQTSLKVTAING